MQLFHEIKPTTKALGLLLNEPDPFHVPLQREVEAAGKAQQIEIVPMMLKGRDELPAAYEEMGGAGSTACWCNPACRWRWRRRWP